MVIKKSHISNEVLMYLRKKIMLKELSEGDHLKESELSRELNISRGPIREAMRRLETEGLVETPSNGRTIVSGFAVQDIKNLYDMRILLEIHALGQMNLDDFQKKKNLFHTYVRQMENAYYRGIREIEADLAYHELIVKLSKNKILIQLWSSLQGVIQTLIDVTSEYVQLQQQEIIEEHKAVLTVIENGDIAEAQHLLYKHLESASIYYIDALKILNKGGSQ